MSADTRAITTDALNVLGTIIDETVGRDAIHLAVEPVIAGQMLKPGQRLRAPVDGIVMGQGNGDKGYGIVDPFLNAVVEPGERFLMVLMPRQIATLRHVWDHPAFPPSQGGGVALGVPPAANPMFGNEPTEMSDQEIARRWLIEYAANVSMTKLTYAELVQALMEWSSNYGDQPWWLDTYEDPDMLWDMLDKLLGYKVRRGEIDLSCRGC